MANKYNCIIIDDEPKAIELLTGSIAEFYDNIQITATFTGWKSALEELRKNEADIVFLDISMPYKSGMDLLELVPQLRSEIIFVTAHHEYALDAFNYNVSGYMLKPIKDKILINTVDKTLERISNRYIAEQNRSFQKNTLKARVVVPNKNGLDYIDLEDIIFFEATSRYTKVITLANEILSSYGIGKFREQIQYCPLFYQVHRSFIVNLGCVKRYERQGIIIMSNGAEIPLSKVVRDDFLKIYDKNAGREESGWEG